MAKVSADIGETTAILETVNRNWVIYKERGAKVVLRPKKKKLRTLLAMAYGSTPFFMNPKQARKKLIEELGEPRIELTVRYFGRPNDAPMGTEVELTPSERNKTCTEFRCTTAMKAFGFLPDLEGEAAGGQGGLELVKITAIRASARVRLGNQSIPELSV